MQWLNREDNGGVLEMEVGRWGAVSRTGWEGLLALLVPSSQGKNPGVKQHLQGLRNHCSIPFWKTIPQSAKERSVGTYCLQKQVQGKRPPVL